MNRWMVALVFAASVLCLYADDITLTDGRVLRDAKVLGQSPTTITVRHSEGFSQVEKAKLPPGLAELYPIDQAAAEIQRRAEIARSERLAGEQAQKADAIRAKSSKPRPDTYFDLVAQSIQIEARPQFSNSREESDWRDKPLSLGAVDMAGLRWEKLFEQRGDSRVRTKLKLAKPYWRVRVELVDHGGKCSFAGAIVVDRSGNKLAACCMSGFRRDKPKVSAIGNAPGEATLDVVAQGGALVVIVEQAVPVD